MIATEWKGQSRTHRKFLILGTYSVTSPIPVPFYHSHLSIRQPLRAGYYHNDWVCSKPIFANIRKPITCCFRPIAFILLIHTLPPPPFMWVIRPISQWLCTVAPVGISPWGKRWFPPPSSQQTLSQTWPISPPDLTLKWACKENVLEQEEKTTWLKPPEEGI